MKTFDMKTIFIFILGGLLILAVIFNQKKQGSNDSLIKELHAKSDSLVKNNEELKEKNKKLDSAIFIINKELIVNKAKLDKTQNQLQDLNKKRNEISSNVNRLSANGVSNAFTDYLNKRTTSSNNN
jgi:outer membrane murein-binding lipoprotein Lpp